MMGIGRLAMLAGLLALGAACSTPQQPGPAAGSSAEPGGPPKVQRVVLGLGPPPLETLKPSDAGAVNWWLRPMYEYLAAVSPEGAEDVPQLATAWNIEPDGKSFRFKLRPGVQFHKGQGEFGAADVVYSWQHIVEKDSKHNKAPYFRDLLSSIEVVNDKEVVFRMNKQDANFMASVGEPEAGFEIMSSKDGGSRAQWPIIGEEAVAGTAPYQFQKYEQSAYIRFERTPYKHWRATPDFPEFEYRFFKETSTRIAALLAKEIHLADLPPDLIGQAEQAGFKSIPAQGPGLQSFMPFVGIWRNQAVFPGEVLNPDPKAPFIFMNTPLLDVRVRKALNKAVDREALNKAFLRSEGKPVFNTHFHPTRPGWDAEWEQRYKADYGYDPQAARQLLAEAGYGPSKPLTHTIFLRKLPFFPAATDMGEAIATYWRAIGVDVKLSQEDDAIYSAKSRRLEYDNHSHVYVTSVRQLLGFGVFNSGTSIGTRSGTELPETDEVFERVRVTIDPKASDTLWRQLGNMAYERYMTVPLFWIPARAVVNPDIVASYVFPGTITGTYTHVENIKGAR